MPVPARRLASGTICVDVAAPGSGGRTVSYARVSSHDRRSDLDRQVAQLTSWAAASGRAVSGVVTEVGSGVDGKRPKLRRVLADPDASVVVVEHRDRLARFGAGHLEAALGAYGRRIVVADPGERAGDLVREMIGVLTWVWARVCGRRGAGSRALRAVAAARHAPGAAG